MYAPGHSSQVGRGTLVRYLHWPCICWKVLLGVVPPQLPKRHGVRLGEAHVSGWDSACVTQERFGVMCRRILGDDC